jgi:hypothetical protein
MAVAVLATATVTLASNAQPTEPIGQVAPAHGPVEAPPLVVPDVRSQAHVFAKVVLEEAGFAWRVRGKVRGYAANVVARQHPEAGTRIHDTGQPTIVLELAPSAGQPQHGRPENRSTYPGSRIRLYDRASVPPASPDRPEGRL